MLCGQKELTIDDKGRLVLPSIFRDSFTDGIAYASLGFDGQMNLYPKDAFNEEIIKFKNLNDFDDLSRKVRLTFFSNTYPLDIDSHNRILLPKELLHKCGLKKKIIAVGDITRLSIYDSEKFTKLSLEGEENFAKNAKELFTREK